MLQKKKTPAEYSTKQFSHKPKILESRKKWIFQTTHSDFCFPLTTCFGSVVSNVYNLSRNSSHYFSYRDSTYYPLDLPRMNEYSTNGRSLLSRGAVPRFSFFSTFAFFKQARSILIHGKTLKALSHTWRGKFSLLTEILLPGKFGRESAWKSGFESTVWIQWSTVSHSIPRVSPTLELIPPSEKVHGQSEFLDFYFISSSSETCAAKKLKKFRHQASGILKGRGLTIQGQGKVKLDLVLLPVLSGFSLSRLKCRFWSFCRIFVE